MKITLDDALPKLQLITLLLTEQALERPTNPLWPDEFKGIFLQPKEIENKIIMCATNHNFCRGPVYCKYKTICDKKLEEVKG